MAESSELLIDACGRGNSCCAELGLGDLSLVEGLSLGFSLLLESLDNVLVAPAVLV